MGTPLVIQGLRLLIPNAGGSGWICDQGTKSHILQPRLKILHAVTKVWHSQINTRDSMIFRMSFSISAEELRF